MGKIYEKLTKCLDAVRCKTDFIPRAALVLGSGLGGFADEIRQEAVIEFSEIDGFPRSTVPGHRGRFVFGYIGPVPAVVMQGRAHYYEGYPISDVVLPVRLMGLMGAGTLCLTNAVGAINQTFHAGDLMLILDHIMYSVPSPLIGANIDELGARFPDMSSVYDPALQEAVRSAATSIGVELREGVYMQVSGPNFETPAEIKAYASLGADVVGMSTACEAVAANHMGLRVCGISCVSNMAAGISKTPLTHDEVQKAANQAAPRFKRLITESIIQMCNTD